MNSSTDGIEFKFEHTPTFPSERRVQNVLNLMVCKSASRCFSPMTDDVCSPGLSPIFGPDDPSVEDKVKKGDADNFKFPKPFGYSNNKKKSPNTYLSKNGQEQYQSASEYQVLNENVSFELDLSTSTKLENSLEVSLDSETSQNNSNILNRTMSITILLKEIGLGEYSEKFAKAGIDLDQFLKINPTDLKSLGFKSDEDCNAIIDMLNAFNST